MPAFPRFPSGRIVFRLAPAVLAFGLAASSPLSANPPRPPSPLAYDTSAYELAHYIPIDPRPWQRRDLAAELNARLAREKQRTELNVYYYRIGHTLAFPLPVARRLPRAELPAGISTIAYPWMIWLSWELEERWRILHFAWREHRDREAGALLQSELAALSGWDRIIEANGQPGLATAHIAGCLAQALARTDGWDSKLLEEARAAAGALLERDVWPWYEKQWAQDRPYDHRRLVNIPVITLARAAQLARVVGSPRREPMDRRMIEVLRTWARFRVGTEFHTEGTTYDGYLLDSVTEWLAALPERDALTGECREAFQSLIEQWIHLTVPGRLDLHAPLGDVEPEMPFWTTVVARIGHWNGSGGASWLLPRVPVGRLPAAALVEMLGRKSILGVTPVAPLAAAREHPQAVSLRTGWAARDVAAFVSASRNPMGHLHADGGHVVLSWQGRSWITDPGYQQYRPGEEREYSLGVQAHNVPVINGAGQKTRSAKVLHVQADAPQRQSARLDLTACYAGLPAGAAVQRDVWLDGGVVVVQDRFGGLPPNAEIGTHWLGGNHFAWAFVDGWARLSDGTRAVWIGSLEEKLPPSALIRHPGSRGPLTLAGRTRLEGAAGVRSWVFWCDPAAGWTPPQAKADAGRVQVTVPGAPGGPLVFKP